MPKMEEIQDYAVKSPANTNPAVLATMVETYNEENSSKVGQPTEKGGEIFNDYQTNMAGLDAHAEGFHTVAFGDCSHAEGKYTVASGSRSHAEGYGITNVGKDYEVEVIDSTTIYIFSAAQETSAKEAPSQQEFELTQADFLQIDDYFYQCVSWAGPKVTLDRPFHYPADPRPRSPLYCYIRGYMSTAKGKYSHAEGYKAQAYGSSSHAEGKYTVASGSRSHTEGEYTTAFGSESHAEGSGTIAYGRCSHAEGDCTIALSESQHVQGKYNILDGFEGYPSNLQRQQAAPGEFTGHEKYAHIVGNGTSELNRSNAHTLDWQGNSWYQGKVLVAGADMDTPDAELTSDSVVIKSSTPGSVKRFKITVTDDGVIKATAVV